MEKRGQAKIIDKDETFAYIGHHLTIAGFAEPLFNENSLSSIYTISAGIPRVINSLALKSMAIGATEKKDILTEEEVYRASQEL